MGQQRFAFKPQLEAFEERLCLSGGTIVLPISAFLSQQGTSAIFTPQVHDQLGWDNTALDPGTTSSDPNRFLMVDYTGQAANYLLKHGINLHTQITGSVTETPIGTSGLKEVSLNLQATNALTWLAQATAAQDAEPGFVNTAPLELGYRAQDLVANPSLKPALSDVHFQVTFQEKVGAPLPDLVQAFNLGNAPPGFNVETYNFMSWGTGTLDAGTTVGTPGKTALVTTSQIGDYSLPHLPGTLADGSFQEPIDVVPLQSPNSTIACLNGTLFVTDMSNGNDNIAVNPAAKGGATVSSNLGSATFPAVTSVDVNLGNGNSNVQIGLSGATVNVDALDGNNNISIGNEAEAVVAIGGGNNNISTGNASLAQQILVVGNGNDNINAGKGANVILIGGNGNHTITTGGSSDSIEVLGNGAGNNTIKTGHGVNVIFVASNGSTNLNSPGSNDTIDVLGNGNGNISAGNGVNVILIAGNGNHNVNAAGSGDSIEVLGNGNNNIADSGMNDSITLGGNGNNNIFNDGSGSFTEILYGNGNNNIFGIWGFDGGVPV